MVAADADLFTLAFPERAYQVSCNAICFSRLECTGSSPHRGPIVYLLQRRFHMCSFPWRKKRGMEGVVSFIEANDSWRRPETDERKLSYSHAPGVIAFLQDWFHAYI